MYSFDAKLHRRIAPPRSPFDFLNAVVLIASPLHRRNRQTRHDDWLRWRLIWRIDLFGRAVGAPGSRGQLGRPGRGLDLRPLVLDRFGAQHDRGGRLRRRHAPGARPRQPEGAARHRRRSQPRVGHDFLLFRFFFVFDVIDGFELRESVRLTFWWLFDNAWMVYVGFHPILLAFIGFYIGSIEFGLVSRVWKKFSSQCTAWYRVFTVLESDLHDDQKGVCPIDYRWPLICTRRRFVRGFRNEGNLLELTDGCTGRTGARRRASNAPAWTARVAKCSSTRTSSGQTASPSTIRFVQGPSKSRQKKNKFFLRNSSLERH